jgi:hypothetical protein
MIDFFLNLQARSFYLSFPSVKNCHFRNNSSVTMYSCMSLATAKHENQIICGKCNSAILFTYPARCICAHGNKLSLSLFKYKLAMHDDLFIFSSSWLPGPRFELRTLASYSGNKKNEGKKKFPSLTQSSGPAGTRTQSMFSNWATPKF